jgi:hypothetical protein
LWLLWLFKLPKIPRSVKVCVALFLLAGNDDPWHCMVVKRRWRYVGLGLAFKITLKHPTMRIFPVEECHRWAVPCLDNDDTLQCLFLCSFSFSVRQGHG